MIRYTIISIISGILFGFLDGVIHAIPLAQRLYAVYAPIARTSIDPLAGIIIDLVYGFILAGLFLLLYKSLPGASGLVKGISFGFLVWFFRVVMDTASQWMMFNVPIETLLYSLFTGLFEMLILGVLYGLTLKPTTSTIEYLEKRAKRGSREKFLEILSEVRDVEPDESDKL